MSSSESIPAPAKSPFAPSEIIIYGVNLATSSKPGARAAAYSAELQLTKDLTVTITPKDKGDAAQSFEIVAAYGYSYEGHCYRFDPVRVLVFKSADCYSANEPLTANACGFEKPYTAWRVSPSVDVFELGTQADSFEKLVLDGNKPGRRAPNTYGSEMQLAHRGGRLSGGV